MKTPIISLALVLLIPLAAAAEKPRALFGVVAEKNPEATQVGLVVQAVLPGSPAESAGLKTGDRILQMNGQPVANRAEMRAVMQQLSPGMSVDLQFIPAGSQSVAGATVVLGERPAEAAGAAYSSPDAAVGGDRRIRPVSVDPAIRQAMREQRRAVVKQLAALPAGFVPEEVSDYLQALRNLARDANPTGRGWMVGKAGEVSLQFKDAAGVLVLYGASNLLTLTVYDAEGKVTHTLPLNTPGERSAVPQEIIDRLQKLR